MCNELAPAEVERFVLNHLTAYQMLHRFANIKRGERVLFHLAVSVIGTSQLQPIRAGRTGSVWCGFQTEE